ncbi:FkbM family methyltransferase [Streptomyces sp. NPDC056831]|uniref:FkbM family methyltransferase n=1 Tax=Streptomyces sp. NPDC056831 TaxID=3345954 RepID=UPI0036965695
MTPPCWVPRVDNSEGGQDRGREFLEVNFRVKKREIRTTGTSEELDRLFLELVSLLQPRVFVEAGAHEAETSLAIAAVVPDCAVVAFEANPYVHRKFTAGTDFAANRVDYRHQALSSRPGEVTFLVITDSASLTDDRVEGYNSLLRRVGGDWLGDVEYEEVTVAATTLDLEFADRPGPFALWLDVEGATEQVLTGGREFLDRCDLLKVEVEETPFWQDQWLAEDVVAELREHGLEPVARDTQTEEQYNVVFASRRFRATEVSA